MSHIIKVSTSHEASYPIHIGQNVWKTFHNFCEGRYSSSKLIIIVDEKVWGLHAAQIKKGCGTYFTDCHVLKVAEGEQSKSTGQWNKLVDATLETGIERGTPILVIGGGVTGDVGGFTASSVLRGVPLLHMPTSLLAMVDSSIGGKTGINHAVGKNLIGAFYQPDAVFADIDFLATLQRREWINGMAEMLKYAAIEDEQLFARLQAAVSKGFKPSDAWVQLIADCARIKVDIVQQDTLEAGIRAYLNFGHTFAHALEKEAGYGTISHGEAVFVGMLAACYASEQLGAPTAHTRFSPFTALYEINLNINTSDISRLVELMRRDKKVKKGIIRLILLHDWECPYIYECTDDNLLTEAWNFALRQVKK